MKDSSVKKYTRTAGSICSYQLWDWNKTNSALMQEHGVSAGVVSRYRSKLNKPKVTKWSSLNCSSWNWKLSNSELAREYALPIYVVLKKRKELGFPAVTRVPKALGPAKAPPKRRYRFDIDWKSLDWNQPNIRLSESIGCTSELVRQKRAELGKARLSVYQKQYERFVEFLNDRDWATPKDFKNFGIGYSTGRRYLLRARREYKPTPRKEWRRRVSPYSQMNWELPNRLLDEIWGLRKGSSGTYRFRLGKRHAAFRAGIETAPERFGSVAAAERKKAKEWNALADISKTIAAERPKRIPRKMYRFSVNVTFSDGG